MSLQERLPVEYFSHYHFSYKVEVICFFLLSTSPTLFYVLLRIHWHKTAIIVIIQIYYVSPQSSRWPRKQPQPSHHLPSQCTSLSPMTFLPYCPFLVRNVWYNFYNKTSYFQDGWTNWQGWVLCTRGSLHSTHRIIQHSGWFFRKISNC